MNRDIKDILENKNLKDNPFKIPGGYFSQMEESVHKRIYSSPVSSTFSVQFKTFATMLSMFLIVFGIGYGVIALTNVKKDLHYNGITDLFIDSNNNDSLSDEELLIIFGENEIYSTAEQINTLEINIQPIQKSEIEEYLIDNNISSFAILASLE